MKSSRGGRMSPRTAALALVPALGARLSAGDFVPPPGDGVVDVRRDLRTAGDGRTDDTALLKAVFEAGKPDPHPRFGSAREIYLPEGVYLVRERLRVGDKKKFIVGQNRERTIIRLADGAEAFQDPSRPIPVIDFGEGSYRGWHFAQNFNQRLVNLTVDTGRGNPGAIGVAYHTNNSGGMHHVSIRTSDPERAGAVGLALSSGPGPGLSWDVSVAGLRPLSSGNRSPG